MALFASSLQGLMRMLTMPILDAQNPQLSSTVCEGVAATARRVRAFVLGFGEPSAPSHWKVSKLYMRVLAPKSRGELKRRDLYRHPEAGAAIDDYLWLFPLSGCLRIEQAPSQAPAH